MIDCPNGEVRDLLPDLLHDRLAPDERRMVELHLAACALCRDELALLRDLRGVLRAAPAVNVAAIAAAVPARRPAPRRSWAGWRVAAAITILAAGGTSVAIVRNGATTSDTTRVSALPTPVATSTGDARAGSSGSAALPAATAAGASAPRELALGTSALGDLDERELTALIGDLRTLDAVTPPEVDNATPVSPVSPDQRGKGEGAE